MKTISKVTSLAVMATLSVQSVAQTAFAVSDAQRIAEQANKNIILEQKRVADVLKRLRHALLLTRGKVHVQQDVDYTIVASRTNIAVGLGTALLAALMANELRTWTPRGIQGGGAAVFGHAVVIFGLGLSHTLALVDLAFSTEANEEQISNQVNATLLSLDELEANLKMEKDKQSLRDLKKDIAAIEDATKLEAKKEKIKSILVKASLTLTGLAVVSGFIRKDLNALETALFAVSSALSAVSGMTGENKKAILQKMDAAVNSIDGAIRILSAE